MSLQAQNGAVEGHRRSQHNRGVEAQNGALEGHRPVVADSHHFDEEQDPDPH